jgi:hypothetical protein
MEALLAFFLFILLSPGLIVTLPPGGGKLVSSEETSNIAVIVHTVIFFVLNKFIQMDYLYLGYLNKAVREVSTKTFDVPVILATVLFTLFSPGFIFTAPPFTFLSEETNALAIVLHGFLYYVVLRLYNAYIDNENVKWFNELLQTI